MRYEKSINRSIPKMPIEHNSERTYFAGLKPSMPDTPSVKNNNLAGDIIDFIMDNPLLTLGGTTLLGSGLYIYGGHTHKNIPIHNPSQDYTDCVKYVMGGVAGLIANRAVAKRLSQAPIEVMALRNEIKTLESAKKKAKLTKPRTIIQKPIQKINTISSAYHKDMGQFFTH